MSNVVTAYISSTGTQSYTLPINAVARYARLWFANTGSTAKAVAEMRVFGAPTPPQSVSKYYFLGKQRLAMRQNGTLSYLHGDHLGSASLATDAAGVTLSQQRYLPYGGLRWTQSGSVFPTDWQYTDQQRQSTHLTGIRTVEYYDYRARMYDPKIGRFISPDSIVPDEKNPQSLNRYAYALGNPVKYTDPSGHVPSVVNQYFYKHSQYYDQFYDYTQQRYVAAPDYTINGNKLGYNACGIFALASSYISEFGSMFSQIANAAVKNGYTADGGIQPSGLAQTARDVFGGQKVQEKNNFSIDGIREELFKGNCVVVDMLVKAGSEVPGVASSGEKDFAHFARVVGVNDETKMLTIENTLNGGDSWTISYEAFMAIWDDPERRAKSGPQNREEVHNWALVIDGSAYR